MHIAVIGRGLIGGSFEKAALRARHSVCTFDKGDELKVADAKIVIVAVPPSAVVSVVDALSTRVGEGAIVVDATGVKGSICAALRKYALETRWTFVGAHPMAGREKSGYAAAREDLFVGASMILTPYPSCGRGPLDVLEKFFKELGFARVVYTTPQHHDEMIAYTSQLCHLISSAYVREGLSAEHAGFSAGSFQDMVRVGAPDPAMWTDLFFANREALEAVLARYVARLEDFKNALRLNDRERMRAMLAEGVKAKAKIDER